MSWVACATSDALFCESLYFTLVRYIILQNCVFENNYYVCVHPRFDPISIKMCLVKKSRDTDTSTRRSEVYRSATLRCDSYWRNILIWKRDNDGRRKILTLQQRVDVLKLLDAGHSFRAVQCRYIEEDADRSNYRPSIHISNGNVTMKIVLLPPNTIFLVVCVRVCVCDFYPDCTKCILFCLK